MNPPPSRGEFLGPVTPHRTLTNPHSLASQPVGRRGIFSPLEYATPYTLRIFPSTYTLNQPGALLAQPTFSGVLRVSETQGDDDVAHGVLSYLAEHPDAMDTLEGIAEWWVMRQQIRVSVTALARVLRRLTEIGILEETVTGDTRRYRLRR